PSNTIANPKSDLKAITTRSGVSYDGPQIPPSVVENEPEATKDTMNPTNNRNTEDVQPQAAQSESPVSTTEPTIAPVSASKPNPKASIPYPSRRNDERNHDKANNQIEKFYHIFKDMTPAPQTQGVSKEDFLSYVKANDAVMKNMQTQGQNMQNQLTSLTDLITKFVNSNTASTSSSGTLPSNTIANPKSDLKAITTRSGVSYDGPQFPPPVVEDKPEATKDTVNPTNNGNTEDVQPQAAQSK
nr:reverse transcriptase domain-containing protein [Tanacetum cinerariifolium]